MFLGIDLGTSSLKTILMDQDGKLLAQSAQEYPIHSPRVGWAEQDPADWVAATQQTIQHILNQYPQGKSAIQGISFSGQMHGLVVIGSHGKPLRPAIIWADQRSTRQVENVYAQLGTAKLAALTANPLTTGFMLASWLWLLENEPDIASQTTCLLLPKDYLRFVLSGEIGTEPSDAASTLLFDPIQRCWQTEICQTFNIPLEKLPAILPSAEVAGQLLADAAQQMGLPAGLPIIFGGGDQACQALGNGIIAPGSLSSTIGTGGQLFSPLSKPQADPHLRLHLFCHAIPNTWHLEAATLSAGLSLRWIRETLLQNRYNYQELADMATKIPPGAEGLLFLPDLAGSRTPHMDPLSRGTFMGLTLRHGPAHLARAVMEGVVMELRQGLELMLSLGARAEFVLASGGGTRHPLWKQLQADIYHRPIYRSQTQEAAAVGAAILAGIGCSVYQDAQEAVHAVVKWSDEVILPMDSNADLYQVQYERFCRLYQAQRSVFFDTTKGENDGY